MRTLAQTWLIHFCPCFFLFFFFFKQKTAYEIGVRLVGSVEILYLVFNGNLPWSDFIWPFALPTLAGNICGGTFIFALLSHAQIRNDMSSKRKAEARAQAAEKGKKADRA